MSLAAKLLDIQANMPDINKDSTNPFIGNRYVSLDRVLEIIVPELHKRDIVLLQPPSTVDGRAALTTILLDAETGERMEWTTPLTLDKATPQAYGSALTYTKRYALLSLFGQTADEDDDAEAAMPKLGPPWMGDTPITTTKEKSKAAF